MNTQTRGVDVGCERYRDNATTKQYDTIVRYDVYEDRTEIYIVGILVKLGPRSAHTDRHVGKTFPVNVTGTTGPQTNRYDMETKLTGMYRRHPR